MKKKFQIFLVFFLTYAFICCPVFARSSFSESNTNDSSSTTPWKARIDSIKTTVASIKDSIPGWIDELKEMSVPPTSSDEMKANKEIRKGVAQDILAKLGINRTR